MTEDEARQKWCYKTFRPTSEDPLSALHKDSTRCIASNCMAWRWTYSDEEGETLQTHEPIKGYCGLAGKP